MEIKGNYLHLLLKRTNKEIPYHFNISSDLYPLQNQDYLNKMVDVVINDYCRILPDDVPAYRKIADPQIFTERCRCIRFDAEAPYVAVYVSQHYDYVLVDSSAAPSQYPLISNIQYDKDNMDIIGTKCIIQSGYHFNDNMLDTFDFEGVVIASYVTEPAVDVIIGLYSDEEFTVYLGSEVWCDMKENIIPDPNMVSKTKTTTIRRMLLEGRVPYGLDQNQVSGE